MGYSRTVGSADTEILLPPGETARSVGPRSTVKGIKSCFSTSEWLRYASIVVAVLCLCAGVLFSSTLEVFDSSSPCWRFITANGTLFMDGDNPFYVVGFNIHNLMEIAMPQIRNSMDIHAPDTVDGVLAELQQDGVNVIRVFAHTTDPRYPFQESPGVYNDDAFASLDYILASCKKHGIRVILSMTDSWKYRGGVQEFIDFSETAPPRPEQYPPPINVDGDFDYSRMTRAQEDYEKQRMMLFFSDEGTHRLYKNHLDTILRRKNTITGIQYKDDPTIFSLSLINEMRCEGSPATSTCPEAVQAWISDVVEHVRSIDTQHMLTIGEEGFYSSTKARRKYNPANWAESSGQDFIRDHQAHPGISYASIHIWPSTWRSDDDVASSDFTVEDWISSHMEDARNVLQKPLLIEEFGYPISSSSSDRAKDIQNLRKPIVDLVYAYVNQSIHEENSLQGSLLWEYSLRMYKGAAMNQYGISRGSTTYNLMKQHAHSIRHM
ncbi:hypothetical protein M9435_000956 [Picochlorum sp. BPE23]|nr:hypothetical protein M9435_000956 [Picochlorum sp. BPE23]